MAKTRNMTREQPGAPPPSAVEPELEPVADAAADERLAAAVAVTAASIGNGGALDWSSLNQGAAVERGYNAADTGPRLPDQSEVDSSKITEPTLTAQGWVIPLNDKRVRFGGV